MPRIIKPAKGTFTSATVTVDSSGRVIAASSGAGAANMVLTKVDAAPSSGANGTFTATNNTSKILVYMRGGGGASGNLTAGSPGNSGGGGLAGFGVLATPISQPFSVPYALGAAGNTGPVNSAGNAGTASTFNTNFVANGGGGGARGGNPGAGGSMGSVTGSSNAIDLTSPGNTGGNPAVTTTAQIQTINSYNAEPIINSEIDVGRAQGTNQTGADKGVVQCGMGGSLQTTTTGNVGVAGGIKIYEDIG
jgi:hypothetical protein